MYIKFLILLTSTNYLVINCQNSKNIDDNMANRNLTVSIFPLPFVMLNHNVSWNITLASV